MLTKNQQIKMLSLAVEVTKLKTRSALIPISEQVEESFIELLAMIGEAELIESDNT